MSANQSNAVALQRVRKPGILLQAENLGLQQELSPAASNTNTADREPVLHLLIVDEDDAGREACAEIARTMSFAVVSARDQSAARAVLTHQKVDVLLLDLKSPDAAGELALIQQVKSAFPGTGVIVMTAFATVASAVEAMRTGAGDYLTKPFAPEELVTILARTRDRRQFDLESRRLREQFRSQKGMGHLIGRSPEMEKLYRILSKVAQTSHSILIVGESGTGKELVARQIHVHGPVAHKPFVPVDCGSMVPHRLERELFGSVLGPEPGPLQAREGLLAGSGGGIVYLDEIAEMTLELQEKLLRVLQEKTVRAVGGGPAIPMSARVLAATSRNLIALVEAGRFRRDLYFRLNVVNLRIPPLRDRRDDIPLLAQHFVERVQRETGVVHTFSDDAQRVLMAYSWPGNVRELEDAIERACALSSGPVLHLGDLPTQLQDFRNHDARARQQPAGDSREESPAPAAIVSIAELERQAILATIRQLKGDKLLAAKLLGIGKTTLYRKLKEYGLSEGEDFSD